MNTNKSKNPKTFSVKQSAQSHEIKNKKKQNLTSLLKGGQLTVDQWRKFNNKKRTPTNEATKINSSNSNKDIEIIFVKANRNDVKEKLSKEKSNDRLTTDQWNELYYKRMNNKPPTGKGSFLEKFGLQNKVPSVELFQCNNSIPSKYWVKEECECYHCELKKQPLNRQPVSNSQWRKIIARIDEKHNVQKNNKLRSLVKCSNSNYGKINKKDKLISKKYSTEPQFSKYIEVVDKIITNGGNTKSKPALYYPKKTTTSKTIIKTNNNNNNINNNNKPVNKNTKPIIANNDQATQQRKSTENWRFSAFQGTFKPPSKQAGAARIAQQNSSNKINAKMDNASSIDSDFTNDRLLQNYLSTVIKQPTAISEWNQIEPSKEDFGESSPLKSPTKTELRTENCQHCTTSGKNTLEESSCNCDKERGSILMKPGNGKTKVKSRVSFNEKKGLGWGYGKINNNALRFGSVDAKNPVRNDITASSPKTTNDSDQIYGYPFGTKKWFLCKSNSEAQKQSYNLPKMNNRYG